MRNSFAIRSSVAFALCGAMWSIGSIGCFGADAPEVPEGRSGTGGSAATGGSVSTGGTTGGSVSTGGTVSTGGSVSTGGAGGSVSTGGTVSTGGSVSTGGTVSSGGSSGGTPVEMCFTTPGAATYKLIDDLNDGDHVVGNEIDPVQRRGYWYTYNDMTCTGQEPEPDMGGGIPFAPKPGGAVGFYAGMTATGCTTWGAGLGFDVNNANGMSCPYNASAYTGITFQYKSNVGIRVNIGTTATIPTSRGGTCSGMCDDHFGMVFPAATSWTTATLSFASATQLGWGTPAAFSAATLVNIQFQADSSMGVPASISIDIDEINFL